MYWSELFRSSQETSVIIATMVELAQRIEMKRPTVARISGPLSRFPASKPTRAREPRTEITRPKDVTEIKPVHLVPIGRELWGLELEKLLSCGFPNPGKFKVSRSGSILMEPSDRAACPDVTDKSTV
jgi:hypothetical protein